MNRTALTFIFVAAAMGLRGTCYGETAIYRNVPDPLPPGGQDVPRWIFPHPGDMAAAQPFITGETGSIESVRLPFRRQGSPRGVVHVEIWDDRSGKPGSKVAAVGDIVVSTVAADPGEVLRFDGIDIDLEPRTPYHFVLENSDLTITSSETYYFLTDSVDDGTNGAAKLMVTAPSWTVLENFISHAKFMRLEIIEAAAEEPKPLEVNIEHAVAVSWDSQSGMFYQIYTSYDMENWELSIENIEGTGERLTQCFIRGTGGTYYRVEEKR